MNTVPGRPPTNATVVALSGTSLLVQWTLDQTATHAQVPITGFVITYKELSGGKNSTRGIKSKMVTNPTGVLTQLRGLASYAVFIQVLTTKGLGFTGTAVTGKTLEDGRLFFQGVLMLLFLNVL